MAEDPPTTPTESFASTSALPLPRIRDFAYAPSHPLFSPTWSPPHEDDELETDPDLDSELQDSSSWGKRYSWTFNAPGATLGVNVSKTDLERNFEEDEEDETSDEDDDDEEDQDSLPPGLYRAIYPFEAEGDSEMPLTEGQIVRVVGKGGGVGWAVVERPPIHDKDTSKHALVPQSYLQFIESV